MKKTVETNITQIAQDKECATAMQGTDKVKAELAFAKLHKRYKSPIFYLVLKYVKMNKETADDLTQEIFMKLYEKIGTYNFSVAFSTWFYNIAINHTIDHKRKVRVEVLSVDSLRSEFGGDEDMSEIAFQIEDKSVDTFDAVIRKERADAVKTALLKLKSDDARSIMNLIFMEDKSYEETATEMNMPLGTIKAIMFRAKEDLRKLLTKKSVDFDYGHVCQRKVA